MVCFPVTNGLIELVKNNTRPYSLLLPLGDSFVQLVVASLDASADASV